MSSPGCLDLVALHKNLLLSLLTVAIVPVTGMTIPNSFEDNNQRVSDRGLVQALVLGQDIGLWSGNKRKTEIAECRELLGPAYKKTHP